jgi:prevent-host-death family protein
VVDEARDHGPQVVTRHGKDVAVVLSSEDYRKITGGSLLSALGGLAPEGGDDFAGILDEIVTERQLTINLPRVSAVH